MPISTASKRYAQAVMAIAGEQSKLDDWQRDLQRVASVLPSAELAPVLENPRVPFGPKKQALEQRLAGVAPLAFNLACLLTLRGHTRLARQIAADYNDLLNERRGIAEASVTAAVPLEEVEKQRIARYLSAATGKRIVLKVNVDPGIIGGMVARVGDRLIDGSVRTTLAQLRISLA